MLRVNGNAVSFGLQVKALLVDAQSDALVGQHPIVQIGEYWKNDVVLMDFWKFGPRRVPIDVEERRVGRLAAVFENIHPPWIFRTRSHVVRHDIDKKAHVMLAQPLDKPVHFLLGTELGIDAQRIGYVVSVVASAARFYRGRRI